MTPRFLDPLQLEDIGGGRWRLVHELRYDSAVLGARVIVDPGFETDLSSIPRLPFIYWAVGGRGRKAGVIHDWLYRTHVGGRAVADRVYVEALAASEDIPAAVRWLMWAGLRLGGWKAYAGAITVLLWATTATADPEVIRSGGDVECAPSYVAMDPDYGALTTLPVTIRGPWGQATAVAYRFPIGTRCHEAQMVVANLLHRVPLGPGWTITLGNCQ